MISAELMYEKVMHRMDMTKETKEEELQEIIRTVLEDESKKEFIPLSEKIRLSRELFNAFRRLDILQDLIEDDSITEIMVNGTENIFMRKRESYIGQTDIFLRVKIVRCDTANCRRGKQVCQ